MSSTYGNRDPVNAANYAGWIPNLEFLVSVNGRNQVVSGGYAIAWATDLDASGVHLDAPSLGGFTVVLLVGL